MGMRHRTRPVPVSNSAAPEGAPDATLKVATRKLAKPDSVSRGAKKFPTAVDPTLRSNGALSRTNHPEPATTEAAHIAGTVLARARNR